MRTKFRNFVPDDAKEHTARVERGRTPYKRLAVDDDVYRLHMPYDKSKHEKFYSENSGVLNQIKQKGTFVANDLPNARKTYRYICYFVQEGYTVKRNVKKYPKGQYYLYTLTKLSPKTYQRI